MQLAGGGDACGVQAAQRGDAQAAAEARNNIEQGAGVGHRRPWDKTVGGGAKVVDVHGLDDTVISAGRAPPAIHRRPGCTALQRPVTSAYQACQHDGTDPNQEVQHLNQPVRIHDEEVACDPPKIGTTRA